MQVQQLTRVTQPNRSLPLRASQAEQPQDSFQPQCQCEIPTSKKVLNALAWATAGVTAGGAATFLLASTVEGSSALGVFVFTPVFAAVGAIAGGVAGWQLMAHPH